MRYKFNYLSFIEKKKIILVCPLDWGLGHASRCVPIIKQFLKDGHEVIIGADKKPLAFLQQEFPALKTVIIPGYEITYGSRGSALKLFYESVQFFNFIKKEHTFIDEIIDNYEIDMLVSDNRYGLWNKKVTSIIITHQLYVKAPLGENIVHKKIEKLIRNFDECWIPDVEGSPNLSGDLAHLKPVNHPHKFIGPLSRFTSLKASNSLLTEPEEALKNKKYEYDIIAIISGPEPQRTIFEDLLLEQIKINKLKAVVVRGLPSQNDISGNLEISSTEKEIPGQARNNESVQIFNHLSTEKFVNYISNSNVVVCRAGYSNIMDLSVLGKKAILVPTPGQTEQEYLADYHHQKGTFYTQKQSEFNLEKALAQV